MLNQWRTCLHVRETVPVSEWKTIHQTTDEPTDNQSDICPAGVDFAEQVSPNRWSRLAFFSCGIGNRDVIAIHYRVRKGWLGLLFHVDGAGRHEFSTGGSRGRKECLSGDWIFFGAERYKRRWGLNKGHYVVIGLVLATFEKELFCRNCRIKRIQIMLDLGL